MEIGCRPVLTVKNYKNKIKKEVVEQIRKMKLELKLQCGRYNKYNKIRKMKMN